jgi:protein-tyrosine phosphatase
MTSILVVCTGNICRSPLAEGLLRHRLAARLGPDAPAVASAGTSGLDDEPASPGSVQAASELGVDIAGHRGRRLTPAMARGADLIVCMAADHRDVLSALGPEVVAKTFTLKELVRALEQLPPPSPAAGGDAADAASALVARVAAADDLRRSGFSGNPLDEDVADPLGLPLETYRATAWELDEWTSRLLDASFGPASLPTPERRG